MTSVQFNIDESVNFYFYLMNMYAYDLSEVNLDFRKKHKNLRSQDFFKIFETLENPFIKENLNIINVSKNNNRLIDLEKEKFNSIWNSYLKDAKKLKKSLESKKEELLLVLNKALSLIDVPIKYDSFTVQIVPFLKPHGKQDTSNFLYLSKKDELSLDDYFFVIVHEILHLVLYDLMNDYYFQYDYTDELHHIEECLINFMYYEAVKDSAQNSILPKWLYLNDGKTYESFCKLVPFQDLINKDIKEFISVALDVMDIHKNE